MVKKPDERKTAERIIREIIGVDPESQPATLRAILEAISEARKQGLMEAAEIAENRALNFRDNHPFESCNGILMEIRSRYEQNSNKRAVSSKQH